MHHVRIPLFLALMLITPAFAHAEFESSDPADGSVLDTTPQSVTLTFTEAIDTKFSTFKVYRLDDLELIDELASDHVSDHSDSESEDDHHSGDASLELSGFVETVTTAREDSDSRVDTGLSATERKVSEVVMPPFRQTCQQVTISSCGGYWLMIHTSYRDSPALRLQRANLCSCW